MNIFKLTIIGFLLFLCLTKISAAERTVKFLLQEGNIFPVLQISPIEAPGL